jgi:hypothetical protein
VRESANRIKCANNLKQIALACHSYESSHGEFSAGSWIGEILPFLEQDAVAQGLQATDFNNGATGVVGTAYGTKQALLYCPSEPRADTAYDNGYPGHPFYISCTWYVAVAGLDITDGYAYTYTYPPYATYNQSYDPSRAGILTSDYTFSYDASGNYLGTQVRGGKISQVTDGLSNTVMIAERPPAADFSYGWAYHDVGWDNLIGAAQTNLYNSTDATGVPCPIPAYFAPGNNTNWCSFNHYWSWHPGGGNFALGDASVRFLPYSASLLVAKMATRAGGETVDQSQY